MVLPTSFATSMLAWGMLTFGDVSSIGSVKLELPVLRGGAVAAKLPSLLLPLPPQLLLCAQVAASMSHSCIHHQELHLGEQ